MVYDQGGLGWLGVGDGFHPGYWDPIPCIGNRVKLQIPNSCRITSNDVNLLAWDSFVPPLNIA